MSQTKPIIRWHELLRGRLDSQLPVVDQDTRLRFDKGTEIHRQIQAWFPKLRAEGGPKKTYVEDLLPFQISYHVDLFDPHTNSVYEIKPLIWWINNQYYSRLQASGYWHFREADRAYFILYVLTGDEERKLDYVCLLPVERVPWIQLRAFAIEQFEKHLREISESVQ